VFLQFNLHLGVQVGTTLASKINQELTNAAQDALASQRAPESRLDPKNDPKMISQNIHFGWIFDGLLVES